MECIDLKNTHFDSGFSYKEKTAFIFVSDPGDEPMYQALQSKIRLVQATRIFEENRSVGEENRNRRGGVFHVEEIKIVDKESRFFAHFVLNGLGMNVEVPSDKMQPYYEGMPLVYKGRYIPEESEKSDQLRF